MLTVQLAAALGIGALAAVTSLIASRRSGSQANEPVRTYGDQAPYQLDRSDFPRPGAAWLVVLFSSSECEGCTVMATKIAAMESGEVATCEIEFHAERGLHERYAIEAVPLVLLADAEGIVRYSSFGALSATDLWAAVAATRAGDTKP